MGDRMRRGGTSPADATAADGPALDGPALGMGVRLGYAAGDFGLNLYWNGMALFLAFFQTDVLGIPARWVGLGFFLASVIDALADPLMGAWADRTATRWGRYRPFILIGAVPLALSYVACFTLPAPASIGGGGDSVLVLVSAPMLGHLALRLMYTLVSIPYSSLSASITQDAGERASLTGFRMGGAFLGGVAVSYLMPALAHGATAPGMAASRAALAVGLLAVAALLWCAFSVREQPLPDGDRGRDTVSDIGGFLRALPRSGPMMRLIPAMMLIQLAVTMLARNLLYFFKYDMRAEDMAAWAIPLFMAASAASIPGWVLLSSRRSKRAAWQAGSAVAVVGSLALLPLPVGAWSPLAAAAAVTVIALIHVGTTVHAVAFWSMLPDLVDYHDWRFGRRDEAKTFGMASLAQKLALGVAGGVLGLLMDAIGFVANAAQSLETLQGLRLIMTVIPVACIVGTMIIMRGYTVTGDVHRGIIADLKRRRPPPTPTAPAPAPAPAWTCGAEQGEVALDQGLCP